MTHLFQPLDLTVNGYAQKYRKKKFNDQIFQWIDDGKSLEKIDMQLQLTTLKSMHTQWLTDTL